MSGAPSKVPSFAAFGASRSKVAVLILPELLPELWHVELAAESYPLSASKLESQVGLGT